jgi:hypothetical protein
MQFKYPLLNCLGRRDDQTKTARNLIKKNFPVRLLENMEGEWSRNFTFIATVFERPLCIVQLLESIRAYYPTVPILICDMSREPLFNNQQEIHPGITWLTLPFENGHTVGLGRNHLLEHVNTPMFFLCDDDHVINRNTDIKPMHDFLQYSQYDIIGGCQGKDDYGTAVFESDNDVVIQHFYRYHTELEKGIVSCDRISNTFLARTDAVRKIGWEERVFANEHAEFFLRASRETLKIAQMADTYVDHKRNCEKATGVLGKILRKFLPHRDREYHSLMVDADNALGRRSEKARRLEEKYCFEKNGIRTIKSISRREEKKSFLKMMKSSRKTHY